MNGLFHRRGRRVRRDRRVGYAASGALQARPAAMLLLATEPESGTAALVAVGDMNVLFHRGVRRARRDRSGGYAASGALRARPAAMLLFTTIIELSIAVNGAIERDTRLPEDPFSASSASSAVNAVVSPAVNAVVSRVVNADA
jgi:hypothetical protein